MKINKMIGVNDILLRVEDERFWEGIPKGKEENEMLENRESGVGGKRRENDNSFFLPFPVQLLALTLSTSFT